MRCPARSRGQQRHNRQPAIGRAESPRICRLPVSWRRSQHGRPAPCCGRQGSTSRRRRSPDRCCGRRHIRAPRKSRSRRLSGSRRFPTRPAPCGSAFRPLAFSQIANRVARVNRARRDAPDRRSTHSGSSAQPRSSSGSPRCAISQSRMARMLPCDRRQEIAGAIVAMHDGDLLRRRRRIALQPADRRAHDRLRFALVLVDHFFPARHFVQRRNAHVARLRDRRGRLHLGSAPAMRPSTVKNCSPIFSRCAP